MRQYFMLSMLILSCLVTTGAQASKLAVFIKDSDLFARQLTKEEINAGLDTPPLSSKGVQGTCLRSWQVPIHQVCTLLNDNINEGENKDRLVRVRLFDSFYVSEKKTKIDTFLTKRSNIATFAELGKNYSVDTYSVFSASVDYNEPESIFNKNIVLLQEPWEDLKNKRLYRTGTPFVCTNRDLDGNYCVTAYDPVNHKTYKTVIPLAKGVIHTHKLSDKEQRSAIVALLHRWFAGAGNDHELPFCWGGTGFNKYYPKGPQFIPVKYTLKQNLIYGWERSSRDGKQVQPDPIHSGFSAGSLMHTLSCLTGRFCGPTTTYSIMQQGKKLDFDAPVGLGDLVTFCNKNGSPIGMTMVSDVKNNLMAGTGGYDDGIGAVYEMSLKKRFNGVPDYETLAKIAQAGKSVEFINKDGKGILTAFPKIYPIVQEWNK